MIRANDQRARLCGTSTLAAWLAVGAVAVGAGPVWAAGAWAITGSLNTARYGHTATLLQNGQVLVAGGTDASGNRLASAELYNSATGHWTVVGNMTTARAQHTATLLPGGEVLVAGGITAANPNNGTYSCIATAELFNPATGRWTATGSMNTARGNHTAALLVDGQVLVAGGLCYSGAIVYENSAELYDPASGKWAVTGSLNIGRAFAAATVLENGEVLIAGGNSTNSTDGHSAELYSNGRWTLTTSMKVSRGGDTAALLPSGDVLVFGGSNLESNATEFYNPTTATWSRTGCYCVNPSIGGQSETALDTGEILVAGGKSQYGLTSISRLYDPAINGWLGTGGLNTARQNHTATLLANGQVLAAGGASKAPNGSTIVLSSAEVYTP